MPPQLYVRPLDFGSFFSYTSLGDSADIEHTELVHMSREKQSRPFKGRLKLSHASIRRSSTRVPLGDMKTVDSHMMLKPIQD